MGIASQVVVGLTTLFVLGVTWIWSLNSKMRGVPPEALAQSPHRWTEDEMLAMYKRIEQNPIDWASHLPPKQNRRYIVTGGYGGVGGQVVLHLLARGQPPESIRVIDFMPSSRHDMSTGPATQIDFAQADISSKEAVEAAFAKPWSKAVADLPLTVFHIAARIDAARRSQRTYHYVKRVNIDGTQNIIDAAKSSSASSSSPTVMIYCSSASVNLRPVRFWSNPFAAWYDGSCQALDESDFDQPLRPHSQFFGNYAHSKAVGERLVCSANSPSFRTGSIRPANCIYGSSEADQAVGLVLRRGTTQTWMPNVIQNFVHGGHVSLGHLDFEAALLRDPEHLPKCAGRAFNISDAGPAPAFGDMYNLLRLTVLPRGRITIQQLQPAVVLALSYVVELFDIASHMPILEMFVPRPKGDLASLQPTVFSAATHTPATDAAARRSVEDGGIGFKHVCTSMEGMAQQVVDWNKQHGGK